MRLFIRNLLIRFPRVKRLILQLICIVRSEPTIIWKGITDNDVVELIGKQDPIILDIGSNDGTQTAWFLALFNDARVYSFEPDPRAHERYLAKVNDKRAALFDLANADRDGDTEFYASNGAPPREQASPDETTPDR